MKILLTGATGYIGKRLLPKLVHNGHDVICCVRDRNRFSPPKSLLSKIEIIEIDLLDEESLDKIPDDIDGAYYLVHSMSNDTAYKEKEKISAINFRERLNQTNARHVVYLSGISNVKSLSQHLESRLQVENELNKGTFALTTLRAAIIIGSGSASFEILRDLVEKLPMMIAPKWLNTKSQPIGIANVIEYLSNTIFNEKLFDNNYDIGGPDVLSYKEMLQGYAEVRGLNRKIIIVPIMTPRLSSYWLYFVTSTTYKLAVALVESMKVEVVCRESDINEILNIEPFDYQTALKRTFTKIENNQIVSSWKDSFVSGRLNFNISEFINIPSHGVFTDKKIRKIKNREETFEKIWNIGGKNGWYYANWLWMIRGFIDKLFGGVGLRRGRTNPDRIAVGDSIDFWRVLYCDKNEGRLLLFAEMKLPGEAWLEFKIVGDQLFQTATFRPLGITGRLYWYSIVPLHSFIFNGLVNKLVDTNKS